MSGYARLELAVLAALLYGCDDEPVPPNPADVLEQQGAEREQARALREKIFDSLGTRGDSQQDYQAWLSRPEICSISNFVTRLEMTTAAFVWPDVFQFRREDHRDFEDLRERWRDFIVDTLDSCVGTRFGSAVRRYNRELQAEFATPRVAAILTRLLDGTDVEEKFALQVIARAPHRIYYERSALLARGGADRVRTSLARTIMLSIEHQWAPADLADRPWSHWLQTRLDDPRRESFDELLHVAVGTRVAGTPDGEISIDIRRAAAKTARVWLNTSPEHSPIDDRIERLAKDSDGVLRREGVQMMSPSAFAMYFERLEEIAKTDPDERIRLIAYMKLPKGAADRIPLDQRP